MKFTQQTQRNKNKIFTTHEKSNTQKKMIATFLTKIFTRITLIGGIRFIQPMSLVDTSQFIQQFIQ